MIKNFSEIFRRVKTIEPLTISVAVAEDEEVLKAVQEANDLKIAKAILVGNKDKITAVADALGVDLGPHEIIDVKTPFEACLKAVEQVSAGRAQILMKGMVDSSVVLKAVLDKQVGLRSGKLLSFMSVFEMDTYHKLLMVTDAGMNIAPTLEDKKSIIQNAVQLAHSLGIEIPKVAILCAKEKVDRNMPTTLDAQKLVEMNRDGEIKDCMVAGPYAMDIAISKDAARHKGIDHPVAGDADIVIVPTIEAGNILYKTLSFLVHSQNSGLILGASAPMVLTSRADSDRAKLNSIALCALMVKKT